MLWMYLLDFSFAEFFPKFLETYSFVVYYCVLASIFLDTFYVQDSYTFYVHDLQLMNMMISCDIGLR